MIILLNNFIIGYIFLNYYQKMDVKNKILEKKIDFLSHELLFVLNNKNIDILENKLNEVEPNNFIEKAFTFLFDVLKKIYINEIKPRKPYILYSIIRIVILLRITITFYIYRLLLQIALLYILLYILYN